MAKAQLTFEDIDVTVTVPAGSRVIEISDKVNSGIIYGCREGDCGTCMMRVVSGWQNLSEPSVLEDRILREHFAGPVSYTHLDVYKRQVMRQANAPSALATSARPFKANMPATPSSYTSGEKARISTPAVA